MRFRAGGYGTMSSALIALPGDGAGRRARFRFAEWQPEPAPWREVSLR
jgi:hypothetical protein